MCEEPKIDYEKESNQGNITDTMGRIKLLHTAGMIGTFIFALLAIITGVRLIPGWPALLVGLLTAMTLIVGPALMVFQLPQAWEDDFNPESDDEGPWDFFWGGAAGKFTETEGNQSFSYVQDSTWGPHWCWYVTVGSTILLFILSGMCAGIKKKKKKKKKKKDKSKTTSNVNVNVDLSAGMHGTHPMSGSPPPVATPPCKICGSATRLVPEYQRWFCDKCQQYGDEVKSTATPVKAKGADTDYISETADEGNIGVEPEHGSADTGLGDASQEETGSDNLDDMENDLEAYSDKEINEGVEYSDSSTEPGMGYPEPGSAPVYGDNDDPMPPPSF